MKLRLPRISAISGKVILPTLVLSLVLLGIFFKTYALERQISTISGSLSSLTEFQQNFEDKYQESLFEEHLVVQQKEKLEFELENLRSEEDEDQLAEVEDLYVLYDDTLKKIDRNDKVELDTTDARGQIGDWGLAFLNQEYEALRQSLVDIGQVLDSDYSDYVASLPPPVATGGGGGEGYSYQSVATPRGTFGVSLIKVPLGSFTVKTVSASPSDCVNDCPTKSLAQYVQENGAFAGINGSYFCPPDYGTCGGKINSFDYAVFNSNTGVWMNQGALSWFKTGLVTFSGGTPTFYRESSGYGGGGVTAGISNYPTLLQGGQVVVNEGDLTSFQRDSKGPRGVIGKDGSNLYLAIVSSATVTDAAFVMQTLGVQDALNLDGGGSSALYSGGYKVGPGRSLPNAILLIR